METMLLGGEPSFIARRESDFRQVPLWCRLGSEKLRCDVLDLRAKFHGNLMIHAGALGQSISSYEGPGGGLPHLSNAFGAEADLDAPIWLRFDFSGSGLRSGAFQRRLRSIKTGNENFVQ